MTLEDSTTYQEIFQKGFSLGFSQGFSRGLSQGITLGMRQIILLLAGQKFGPPTLSVRSAVNSISDPAALEQLALRIRVAGGWDDLLYGD